MPRRKAATTIDTATAEEDAEEDVKDFDVPGFDQVLLLSALCKRVRDEVQAQSQSLTSST